MSNERKIRGVFIHPCMRKYRVGLFSDLNKKLPLDVIESSKPQSGNFVKSERVEAVSQCTATFVRRSKFKIPILPNTNLSIFKALLPRYKFVIFSAFGSIPFLILSIPCKMLRKKIFVFDETWEYPQSRRYRYIKPIFKLFGNFFVDGFFLASTRALKFNEKFFSSKVPRVVILNTHSSDYPLVDTGSERSSHILYLGRTVKIKGLDVLIRAIEEAGVSLTVYGDGADLAEFKALAEKLHVTERVSFKGPCLREDVDKIMASHDIFVLPSRRMSNVSQSVESWGFTVNEALSNGCRVVVSDAVGCADDLIVPGFNGDVFQSENSSELAAKLIKLKALPSYPQSIRDHLTRICNNSKNAAAIDGVIRKIFDC